MQGSDVAVAGDQERALEEGADLVAFGRPFIANPDLVERLRSNVPLNEVDKATLYGGGEKGYTDYPSLDRGRERLAPSPPSELYVRFSRIQLSSR